MPDQFSEWKPPDTGGQVPDAWVSQVYAYLQQHPLPVPISQVTGYQKSVSGFITGSSGAIVSANPAGTFTIAHPSVGNWTVTFSKNVFSKTPAVQVSYSSLTNGRVITYGNTTKSGFDVQIFDPAGVAQDHDWSFSAQGS